MHKSILIVDIDECVYSSLSQRPDNLSQPIIDKAIQGGFTAVIACTHRSVYNLEYCQIEALRIAADHNAIGNKAIYDRIISNFPTSIVMPRFADVTQLPLLAISMHDDILYDTCGVTYENIVKPLEMFSRLLRPEHRYLSREEMIQNWHTKNPQLRQIIKFVLKTYPEDSFEFHYCDDKLTLCKEALKLKNDADWRKSDSFRPFHYNYVTGVLTEVKPAQPTLDAGSVFAKPISREQQRAAEEALLGDGLKR